VVWFRRIEFYLVTFDGHWGTGNGNPLRPLGVRHFVKVRRRIVFRDDPRNAGDRPVLSPFFCALFLKPPWTSCFADSSPLVMAVRHSCVAFPGSDASQISSTHSASSWAGKEYRLIHIPPSQGESPFPLDFYLSWMSTKLQFRKTTASANVRCKPLCGRAPGLRRSRRAPK
jgi:hypothetical protein